MLNVESAMHPALSALLLLLALGGYIFGLAWLARLWLVPERKRDALE